MSTRIFGLGTATPCHHMSQQEAVNMFTEIVCTEEKQARLARTLFSKSGVENRHTVVPHNIAYNWCQSETEASTSNSEAESFDAKVTPLVETPSVVAGTTCGPTTGERMQMYAAFAADLACDSATAAFESCLVKAEDITHLVTVTCTGFDSPGVDFELINRLGLPPTTQRINVGFMGCHAAVNGLRVARAITQADPTARVLLNATELCSLHYRFQWDSEGIIGNALFADGSASMILGQEVDGQSDDTSASSVAGESLSGWQLIDTGSVVIPDSSQSMSWKVGDYGFEMLLTNEIGEKIEAGLGDWLDKWLEKHGICRADVGYWGVHPGGPRILSAVEKSLDLPKAALATSRDVLKQNGNMSSPTVLFVFEQFLAQHAQNGQIEHGNCVLLGFGPGLVAEIALLQKR